MPNRATKPRRTIPQVSRYNDKTVHRDREYGFYWYSGLWSVLRPILVLLCAMVIVVGVVSSGIRYVRQEFFMPVDENDHATVDFTIESGTTVTGIGQKLYDEGLLRNKGVFKYIVQFQGLTSKIQHGSYPLSKDMDVFQIIEAISAGSASNERTITIIPGWTVEDIADYLRKQGAITSVNVFLGLCNKPENFRQDFYCLQDAAESGTMSRRKYALEGYLAPDTYRVYTNASPEDIIRTLLRQTDTVVDRVFNTEPVQEIIYDEAGEIVSDETGEDGEPEEEIPFETTLTRDQTLILASIIEKEAARRSDYAKVSAVLHNRIEQGMALESDATVSYPTGIDRLVLTAEELAADSPYNTYVNTGLPAGPICNPSPQALTAALYPDTDYIYEGYLYFCAADPASGELVFARTREEHLANVAKYRDLWLASDEAKKRR